ncbi:phosphatase phospho-type [Chytriomyces sp. MP71]|nr:phosphatase phospho-type [Chytriomyces sp. MP71]
MTEKLKPTILAAFDFDYTLVDDDSDHFVFDSLSPLLRKKMSELTGNVQWTDLMHQLLGELHSEGVSKSQIIETLGSIQFNPAIRVMMEAIKAAGGDIIIVSDANTIYIDEILKAKNARELIAEIVTNPGTWDDTGRLHVSRRIAPPLTHGCTSVCSVNLCKGSEMLQRMEQYDVVLYGGDGKNDYCPMTKLSAKDYAFARRGHSLEKLLDSRDSKHIDAIKAKLIWWTEGEDLLAQVQDVLAGL